MSANGVPDSLRTMAAFSEADLEPMLKKLYSPARYPRDEPLFYTRQGGRVYFSNGMSMSEATFAKIQKEARNAR